MVKNINESGYWKLPFRNMCDDLPMDAGGYILEANTHERYNVVNTPNCGDSTKYSKACQELIKYAGMDKEIQLIWTSSILTEEPIKVHTEIKEEQAPKPKKKKAK